MYRVTSEIFPKDPCLYIFLDICYKNRKGLRRCFIQ